MNICFLSYEYPPGTSDGIGSYVYQVSRALALAGHEVTVIAGEEKPLADEPLKRLRVIRLRWQPEGRFPWDIASTYRNLRQVAQTCRTLHWQKPFDLIEAPDYRAEAYYLLQDPVDCAVITKLHTPGYPLWELEADALGKPFFQRRLARWLTMGPRKRLEKQVLWRSTRLHAPSRAVARLVEKYYGIDPAGIDLVPYPYRPSASEGSACSIENREPHVLYVGRLEVRKGVHLFAQIIPEVLRHFPQARFQFLGQDAGFGRHPSMAGWLRGRLGKLASRCEFLGPVPYHQVPTYMRCAAVCVFPSLWDNFPNVCLEAMAAGACVVGSLRGGMAEMLQDGECGFLADPQIPETFAEKILMVLSRPQLRQRLGQAARQRVHDLYRPEVILPRQIEAYRKAIEQVR
jgi:glycosyltransferase involved in cell wall biosynthesis|uniref:Glycosyltransferase family 1 protein n=1 Tax=Desulfobacca acetoxidans TaxID=60893 RepID=A0A7C3WG66_9BACT